MNDLNISSRFFLTIIKRGVPRLYCNTRSQIERFLRDDLEDANFYDNLSSFVDALFDNGTMTVYGTTYAVIPEIDLIKIEDEETDFKNTKP